MLDNGPPLTRGRGKELDKSISVFPWYAGKVEMRKYMAAINANKKVCSAVDAVRFLYSPYLLQVIEYTLFQPGVFMEYIGYPKKTAKHMTVIHTVAGFESRRIIGLQGHFDDHVTFTSVQDIAEVVARAIEYEGEWPVWGGISGDKLSLNQIKDIGEKLQGTCRLSR